MTKRPVVDVTAIPTGKRLSNGIFYESVIMEVNCYILLVLVGRVYNIQSKQSPITISSLSYTKLVWQYQVWFSSERINITNHK